MKLPKSQNRKGLAFILLAVVCAFIAAGLVFAAGSRLAPSVPVLEANTDISPGDPLDQGQFKEVKLPPAGLPAGAMTPNVNLSNAIAARGLTAGDILRSNAIIRLDAADPPLLSARLRALNNQALRAMEVPIEAAAGLLSGMKAGDKVDIISVSQSAPQQGAGQQKQLLVPHLLSELDPPGKMRGSW
ncbi:MAG: SAF domain-containing protein [Bacillota bacterium]